jgi:hypothetical protein
LEYNRTDRDLNGDLPNAPSEWRPCNADISKLREYCLNPHHPQGRHKARVFMTTLGMTAADAKELQAAILAAARSGTAFEKKTDIYGRRYVMDATIKRGERRTRTLGLDRQTRRRHPEIDQKHLMVLHHTPTKNAA